MVHNRKKQWLSGEAKIDENWYVQFEDGRTKALEKPLGTKHDQGKLQWHLLPPDAIEEVTRVLMFGAEKYAPRDWEKGISYSRCFNACMRHMWAWWKGEDKDSETGISHLAHAACCVFFLLAYEQRKMKEFDDRPTQ